MDSVEEMVAADRGFGRLLALLPAVVVGVCVRALTLASAPMPVRIAAAAVIAMCCWAAYRLLTARLTVDEKGLHVRGVFYDADIAWSDIRSVQVVPASRLVRMMVWGVMQPHTLAVETPYGTLRPVVTLGAKDDHGLRLVLGAIRAYQGRAVVPSQRRAEQTVTHA